MTMVKLYRRGAVFLVILLVLSAIVGYGFTATTRLFHQAQAASASRAQYVNPFVGTGGSGNTFPGVSVPFGEVQWSPDTTGSAHGASYNYKSSTITGFSLTHLSGSGWFLTHGTSTTCGIYGDVPFMPYKGPVTQSPAANPSAFRSSFSHSSETARPGYYSVQISTPGVKAELTAATHTAFGQFSYPTSTTSTMLISTGGTSKGASGTVAINASTHEVTGSATAACSSNGSYTLEFVGQFSVPFTSSGTWKGTTLSKGATSSSGSNSGAYVTFTTTTGQPVEVTIGVSFVSVANARANTAAENPGSFSTAQSNADSAWNSKLNTITVNGSSSDMQTFYTALYHMLLFPSTFLQAMLKGATKTCTAGSYVERQGLSQYLSLGYIPYGTSGLRGTSSATLEYTSDDFAISQFAQALGDTSNAATFLKRAQNWQNLYDSATGLIEPKNSSGSFVSNTSGSVGFHGGTATQYTWMVPYNLAGLFTKMGGNQTAVNRLDPLFSQMKEREFSNYAYLGNGSCVADPIEKDFAGRL